MIRPTAELYTLLRNAAAKHRVPLTLLEALAFDASGFDPAKKTEQPGAQPGATTKQGLFGFTDDQCEAYGVVNPFDAAQAIEGACLALRDIFKDLPDIAMAIAAWKLGKTAPVAHLPGTTPETWPTELRRYVQRMVRIRYWFQNQGLPKGTGPVERLDNAIRALTDLNMGNAAITETAMNARAAISVARDAMMDYKLSRVPDAGFYLLKVVWLKYRDAFDTAPITSELTPVPELIEPSWWKQTATEFTPLLEDIKSNAGSLGEGVLERIDKVLVGGLVIAGGLGALYILANLRRRSA